MATYSLADRDDFDLLSDVTHKYHKPLVDAGVTLGLLMARAPADSDGPALRHHGYPALAVVKVNPLKDRVEGKPDATVTLDAEAWEGMADARRRAVLDHELTHLEVVTAEGGGPKLDDAGRPKLRIRLHDMEVGGFEEVVRRHGRAAAEADQYADLHRRMSQLDLFAEG